MKTIKERRMLNAHGTNGGQLEVVLNATAKGVEVIIAEQMVDDSNVQLMDYDVAIREFAWDEYESEIDPVAATLERLAPGGQRMF